MDLRQRDTQPPSPIAAAPVPGRFSRPVRLAGHLLLLCLFIGAVILTARWGLAMRQWTYEHTDRIRHRYDIRHNLLYGGRAIDDGVLDLYGNIQKENPNGNYGLDYVPLRLVTMRQWVVWVRAHYGKNAAWQKDFKFTSPLLYFNSAMEGLSAIAIFLLVRLWIRRAARAEASDVQTLLSEAAAESQSSPAPLSPAPLRLSPWRGCLAGFVGAMLMWFSPASQISAHGWPSWDIWIVPFYLWTVLLACVNGWFCAGMVLGIGTMFKGQQLMVVPLFLLWPLFMGRRGAALRWAAGYLFAGTLIVAPWLLRSGATRQVDRGAVAWVAGGLLACLILALGRWVGRNRSWRGSKWWRIATAIVAAGLLLWPGFLSAHHGEAWIVLALAAVVVAFGWFLRPRHYGYLVAGTLGLCLALCPIFFSSDLTWWDVSFRYGSEKFPSLAQWGSDALPSLLQIRFHWHSLQDVVYTFQPGALWLWPKTPVELPLRMALVGVYAVCLVLCAWGMARQFRRGDRHFLAAMAGVGVGMVLLDILLIGFSWLMTMHMVMWGGPRRIPDLAPYLGDWARPVYNLFTQGYPDFAWPIMLIALIFLYVGLVPSRRRLRPHALGWRRCGAWVRQRWARRQQEREVFETDPDSNPAAPALAPFSEP